jgi:hypothetical protein
MKMTITDYFESHGLRCSRCFKIARLRSLLYPRESQLGCLGSYCDECMKFIQENYS